MKLNKRQLKRIIREEKQKLFSEGAYEKLNADVTSDDSNLDQELWYGLESAVYDLCHQFAKQPRFAKHGVSVEDVLEELKNVVYEI